MKALVTAGADTHATNIDGATPLHHAAFAGHVPVVEFLLNEGASPHVRNVAGFVPGDFADAYGPVSQLLKRAQAEGKVPGKGVGRSNYGQGVRSDRSTEDDDKLLEQAMDGMRQRRFLKKHIKETATTGIGLDTWRSIRLVIHYVE